MRILLATDNYPPIIGGGQIQSQFLAKSLRARGHEVIVATVWQHGVRAMEDDEGFECSDSAQMRTLRCSWLGSGDIISHRSRIR